MSVDRPGRLLNTMGFPGEVKHNTEDCLLDVGSLYEANGCLYRYVRASAAIAAGNAVISDLAVQTITNANSSDNTGDRATGRYPWIQDTDLDMTENIYRGCFLYLNGGTGAGQMKRVVRNSDTKIWYAALHPFLGETDPFTTDPSTDTDGVIIAPFHVKKAPVTTQTNLVVGVAPYAFTSGYYGFIVDSGVALATVGGAIAAGKFVIPGDDTAGQLVVAGADIDLGDATPCGFGLHASTTDQAAPILFRAVW